VDVPLPRIVILCRAFAFVLLKSRKFQSSKILKPACVTPADQSAISYCLYHHPMYQPAVKRDDTFRVSYPLSLSSGVLKTP
jgi:hypothetical protein